MASPRRRGADRAAEVRLKTVVPQILFDRKHAGAGPIEEICRWRQDAARMSRRPSPSGLFLTKQGLSKKRVARWAAS